MLPLDSIKPSLPNDLILALEEIGVKTDVDLLFSEPLTGLFAKLPPGIVSLRDFNLIIAQVTENAAAPPIRADEYLETETHLRESLFVVEDALGCGVPELDRLVGMFSTPRVFEISGDRGSGKTVSHVHSDI